MNVFLESLFKSTGNILSQSQCDRIDEEMLSLSDDMFIEYVNRFKQQPKVYLYLADSVALKQKIDRIFKT